MSLKPFALSVKALVRGSDGQYLFMRRSMDSQVDPGLWDLPGGKVEGGESFPEALVRETFEETGLTIVLEQFIGVAEFEVMNFRVIGLFMVARTSKDSTDTVQLSHEHSEHRWVSTAELADFDLCPSSRPVVLSFAKKNL